MQLAVLSDVHGNLPALEAVMIDVLRQRADGFIVAGDFVDRPQPFETVQMVQALEGWLIRGNREHCLLAYDTGDAPDSRRGSVQWLGLRWIYDCLDGDTLDFLAELPEERVVAVDGTAPIRVVHASPGSVSAILLPRYDHEGAFARAMLLGIETGQNVPGRLVAHFGRLATEAGFKDHNYIPDAIWENAIITFDWDAAARNPW